MGEQSQGRSLPWFRVDVDLVDHPKVLALAEAWGVSEAEAGWAIIRLWAWTMRYAARGRLAPGARPALERACNVHPTRGDVLSGLVAAGWVDDLGPDGWEIHDWGLHNGAAVVKAEKDAERKRTARARRSDGRGQSADGRADGAGNGTERDGTEREKKRESVAADVPFVESEAFALLTTKPDAVETLRGIWNEHRAEPQPEWREMGAKRRKAAQARVRERSLDEWEAVVKRIAASAFCRGENERGWRADPDFLLRPDTAAKVLEGKYDDRRAQGRGPVPAEATDWTKQPTGEMPF